jgi:hypothetical protein
MKKIILAAGLLSIAVVSMFVFTQTHTTNTQEAELSTCNHGQCSAVKKNGYQCGNCAQKGSWYCWSHGN